MQVLERNGQVTYALGGVNNIKDSAFFAEFSNCLNREGKAAYIGYMGCDDVAGVGGDCGENVL